MVRGETIVVPFHHVRRVDELGCRRRAEEVRRIREGLAQARGNDRRARRSRWR
jgi:hypothetical protein